MRTQRGNCGSEKESGGPENSLGSLEVWRDREGDWRVKGPEDVYKRLGACHGRGWRAMGRAGGSCNGCKGP